MLRSLSQVPSVPRSGTGVFLNRPLVVIRLPPHEVLRGFGCVREADLVQPPLRRVPGFIIEGALGLRSDEAMLGQLPE